MPGPIKLEDHSPAYKAYKSLQRAPQNLPSFSLDRNDRPKVRKRELWCRMAEEGGQVCGVRCDSEARLWDHLESVHMVPDRPNLSNNVLSRDIASQLDRFYKKIMRHEDYEGKGARTNGVARKSALMVPGPPPSRSAHAPPPAYHDDDEDDNEPQVVKREESGVEDREVVEIDLSQEPEPRPSQGSRKETATQYQTPTSTSGTMEKRKREDDVEIASDEDEDYLRAQLKEKRAKRELKEAALEEAEFERKLAARKKK